MPEGYGERFLRCAQSFEEASYSTHSLSGERRTEVLALLKETADTLYAAADRRSRFYLKYWMCMVE